MDLSPEFRNHMIDVTCLIKNDTYFIGNIIAHGKSLSAQVEFAYDYMFNITKEFPFLINCRNFVPNILSYEHGEQRYKSFNATRKMLFEKNGITTYPTACCVGSSLKDFSLKFITSNVPAIAFNNPEQINAYEYPIKYGSSPLFSRAATHNGLLLISGTASIKGSETVYVNNIVDQLRVTLENIKILIDESKLDTNDLTYITYVKNAIDVEYVSSVLRSNQFHGPIINADMCRDDLLVEIEVYSRNLYDTNFL